MQTVTREMAAGLATLDATPLTSEFTGDAEVAALRDLVAQWDELHSTTGLPPYSCTVHDAERKMRRHRAASAAVHRAEAELAAAERAAAQHAATLREATARVQEERRQNVSDRENTMKRVAGRVPFVPASPLPPRRSSELPSGRSPRTPSRTQEQRPSTAAATPARHRYGIGPTSPRLLPPRPPTAPATPLPRPMRTIGRGQAFDTDNTSYLTKWWCEGGHAQSSVSALFPRVLSPRDRGVRASCLGQFAHECGCVAEGLDHFRLAAQLAPTDIAVAWAVREGEYLERLSTRTS